METLMYGQALQLMGQHWLIAVMIGQAMETVFSAELVELLPPTGNGQMIIGTIRAVCL